MREAIGGGGGGGGEENRLLPQQIENEIRNCKTRRGQPSGRGSHSERVTKQMEQQQASCAAEEITQL